jgi:hypothetical protein
MEENVQKLTSGFEPLANFRKFWFLRVYRVSDLIPYPSAWNGMVYNFEVL